LFGGWVSDRSHSSSFSVRQARQTEGKMMGEEWSGNRMEVRN